MSKRLLFDDGLPNRHKDWKAIVKKSLSVITDLDSDEYYIYNDEPISYKIPRSRENITVDFSQTRWGKFITDPEVKDFNSRKGRLFRRRFRVPFHVFTWIVTKCTDANIFEVKRQNAVRIPVAIKVLISLRILGRGDCCDSISEYCDVSESHCRMIFLLFVKNFRKSYQKEIIKVEHQK